MESDARIRTELKSQTLLVSECCLVVCGEAPAPSINTLVEEGTGTQKSSLKGKPWVEGGGVFH